MVVVVVVIVLVNVRASILVPIGVEVGRPAFSPDRAEVFHVFHSVVIVVRVFIGVMTTVVIVIGPWCAHPPVGCRAQVVCIDDTVVVVVLILVVVPATVLVAVSLSRGLPTIVCTDALGTSVVNILHAVAVFVVSSALDDHFCCRHVREFVVPAAVGLSGDGVRIRCFCKIKHDVPFTFVGKTHRSFATVGDAVRNRARVKVQMFDRTLEPNNTWLVKHDTRRG